MRLILRRTALWISGCFVGLAVTYGVDDAQTVKETVDKIMKSRSTSDRPQGVGGKSEIGPSQSAAPTPESCPEPTSLDLFKYQIVFDKTGEDYPLKGLDVIHIAVWERGPSTAFYIRDPLPEFSTDVRIAYLFTKDLGGGGGTCPARQDWTECVERFAGVEAAGNVARTCMTMIDIRTLPVWEPSPDSPVKRRLADRLRSEIEAKWAGAQEIVIRDFNLSDPQITMYLRMPEGEYFRGCALDALREPHCDGWHLFGQVPSSSIRQFIFDRPYRLK